MAATQIHELEETLGLLRAKHAILQCREVDANEQVGRARDTLHRHGITEVSQSDDEGDGDNHPGYLGYSHTFDDDEAHYPPSSDLPSFVPSGSSDSDSDSEEYPTSTSQISTGAVIASEGADAAANEWYTCGDRGDGDRGDGASNQWRGHEMHATQVPASLKAPWVDHQRLSPGPGSSTCDTSVVSAVSSSK